MKYFLDTEFIEGFKKTLFGKRRHFIDLISIGIVDEAGVGTHMISSEYNYNDASEWVKQNVILPLYIDIVHGDMRNKCDASNFHKLYGRKNSDILWNIQNFFGCWRDVHFYRAPDDIEIYGYYSDYDWVLFCSLFGRMIDLPKEFPMYCKDLKQSLDEKAETWDVFKVEMSSKERLELIKNHKDYPKQSNEHNALSDAKWNKELYNFLQNI